MDDSSTFSFSFFLSEYFSFVEISDDVFFECCRECRGKLTFGNIISYFILIEKIFHSLIRKIKIVRVCSVCRFFYLWHFHEVVCARFSFFLWIFIFHSSKIHIHCFARIWYESGIICFNVFFDGDIFFVDVTICRIIRQFFFFVFFVCRISEFVWLSMRKLFRRDEFYVFISES